MELICVSCTLFERREEKMFMGSFMFIVAGLLYWLLIPPVPNSDSILREEIAFTRDQSQNSEGVAGCLISQPSIR